MQNRILIKGVYIYIFIYYVSNLNMNFYLYDCRFFYLIC